MNRFDIMKGVCWIICAWFDMIESNNESKDE